MTGDMVRMALDEADPAMAELEQMANHFFGCRDVVDAHIQAVVGWRAASDRDDRHADRSELREDRLRLRQRGRQHQRP